MMKFYHCFGGILAVVGFLLSLHAQAAVYNFSATGSGTYSASWCGTQAMPDYSAAGLAYALHFGETGQQIHDVKVTLNITGGWNGDLYAYLSHGSGFAVLLNRVGASPSNPDGYGTSGLNIILTSGTAHPDIHGVQAPDPLGLYQADGRLNYTDSARNNTLNVFEGRNPAGDWTLFFADRSGGDVSTLTGWSVEFSAVPEPVNVALGCFGLLLAVWQVRKWWWRLKAAGN